MNLETMFSTSLGWLWIIVLVLLIVVSIQQYRLSRLIAKNRQLLHGARRGNLEEILNDCLADIEQVGAKQKKLEQFAKQIAQIASEAITDPVLVRYNSFDDMGGKQSFTLGLLNHKRDGVIMTSLHGRAETRVYSKRIVAGEPKHPLSDEENVVLAKCIEKLEEK